ncbi:MAG: MarR family winged helix-turn-helix transcriptional regulator [Planctomycetota bacterium]|jgi:DNA-binding MarR family transcriptional regulator
MSLKHELGLRKPIAFLEHEALLNIYFTATCMKKRAAEFLRRFGLTDVQLNVLMLLHHQSGAEGGLSQAKLSDMMLVNRANITSLVDRMEKAGLVVRTAAANDRRFNIVKLTDKARKLYAKVDPLYRKEVTKTMSCLNQTEQKKLVGLLERVRATIAG